MQKLTKNNTTHPHHLRALINSNPPAREPKNKKSGSSRPHLKVHHEKEGSGVLPSSIAAVPFRPAREPSDNPPAATFHGHVIYAPIPRGARYYLRLGARGRSLRCRPCGEEVGVYERANGGTCRDLVDVVGWLDPRLGCQGLGWRKPR